MSLKDWTFVDHFCEKLGTSRPWDDIAKIEKNWAERLNRCGPLTYQLMLYAMLRAIKPTVVVETGVYRGVSSVLILRALQENGIEAKLYSCDPAFKNAWIAQRKIMDATKADGGLFEGWIFKGAKGIEMMPDVPGPWDVFVHDSDHRAVNIRSELDIAWDKLRPGGVIVCDDWQTREAKDVFPTFAEKHALSIGEIATAAVIQKPGEQKEAAE
jgi:predicted O-methyltransferase YrrM